MAKLVGLSCGSCPLATFPNSHRALAAKEPTWASATKQCALEQLRLAVKEEDWAGLYASSLTKIHMQAEWSASPERCAMLQAIACTSRASRVLEVGSFCGAGALALAEAVPEDGEVVSLELDDFVVGFGKKFQARSPAGHKIKHLVGPALASLESLAKDGVHGQPFDLAVLDADKGGMQQYFELLLNTPGMLTDSAVICVDLTPYKGQPPLRYIKYKFPYPFEAASGQKEIDQLRASVACSKELVSYEFGRMLVVQKKGKLAFSAPGVFRRGVTC